MLDMVMLVGGGTLLYFGAEWLVGGAAGLAYSLRVRPVLVGLTIVAYGTSAPEAIVSFQAAREGAGALALANIVGSNIVNLGLVLGLTTLVHPPRVASGFVRREIPILLATALAVPLTFLDGVLSSLETLTLLGASIAYTGWMVSDSMRDMRVVHSATATASGLAVAADEAGAPNPGKSRTRLALTAGAGLGTLMVGGTLLVNGATGLARTLGMSEWLIGVTIVSAGTSLPELATSILAARRGHSDIAIGNIIGSNIFNVLMCLGIAGLGGVIATPLASIRTDVMMMLLLSLLVSVMIRKERSMTRAEGALLACTYLAFVATLAVFWGRETAGG